MKVLGSILFLLLFLMLLGCNKTETPSAQPAPLLELDEGELPILADAKETPSPVAMGEPLGPLDPEYYDKVEKAEVHCSETCDARVGFLITRKAIKASTCTASLIGPDLILTNRHCIESVLYNCSENVAIKLPETPEFPEETAFCKELVAFSEAPASRPADQIHKDYAVIRMDRKTDRPHFEMSRSGFAAGESFRTVSFLDPENNLKAKQDTKENCVAQTSSLLAPSFRHRESAKISLFGCRSQQGNSGAPIIDADGRIRGIITAAVDSQLVKFVQKNLPHVESRVTIGSNLACEEWSDFLGADCQNGRDENVRQGLLKEVAKSVRRSVRKAIRQDLPRHLNQDISRLTEFRYNLDSKTSIKGIITGMQVQSKLDLKCYKPTRRRRSTFVAASLVTSQIQGQLDSYWRLQSVETSQIKVSEESTFRILRNKGIQLKSTSGFQDLSTPLCPSPSGT